MTQRKQTTHYCTQEEAIKAQGEMLKRINYLLVGNGEPEEGLAFKFAKFMSEHKQVVDDIGEIKTGVNGLHERADENKKAAATVASALEKYQAETKNFEAGKEAMRLKRNLTVSRIMQIITILISLTLAYIGYKNLNEGQKAIQTEVVKDMTK